MSLIPDETGSDDRPRTEQPPQTPTPKSDGLVIRILQRSLSEYEVVILAGTRPEASMQTSVTRQLLQ